MIFKSDTCKSRHTGEPLTSYGSEDEAKDGADYATRMHGKKMSPYKCANCDFWHLKPADRIANGCNCTDSNGDNKKLYFTREAAEEQANKLSEAELYVYECDYGKGFHLSHSKE